MFVGACAKANAMQLPTILADFQQCDVALSKLNKSIVVLLLHHAHLNMETEENANSIQVAKTLVKSLSNKVLEIENILDLISTTGNENEQSKTLVSFSEYSEVSLINRKIKEELNPLDFEEINKEKIHKKEFSDREKVDVMLNIENTTFDKKPAENIEAGPSFNQHLPEELYAQKYPTKENPKHFWKNKLNTIRK